MADAFERVGDTGVKVHMQFPDSKSRDDFEVVVKGWVQEYKDALKTRVLLMTAAANQATRSEADVTGYIYREERPEFGYAGYIDFIPGW